MTGVERGLPAKTLAGEVLRLTVCGQEQGNRCFSSQAASDLAPCMEGPLPHPRDRRLLQEGVLDRTGEFPLSQMHLFPVVLVGGRAAQAYLIVAAVGCYARPGEAVVTPGFEKPFQQFHGLSLQYAARLVGGSAVFP